MFLKKLKASTYHLIISVAVVGALLAFFLTYWYPGLSAVAGLTEIVLIMIAVDLVVGPLLTFIVYRPGKPKLKFDLAAIAVMQLSALAYATYTVYEGHPLYITYAVDRFTLVTANEVDPAKSQHEQFAKSRLAGPDIAFAKMPEDKKEADKILLQVVLEGAPDIDKRPELYKPYEDHLDDIFAKSVNLEKLLSKEDTRKELTKFLDEHGGDRDKYAYLPLSGNGKDVIWALDKTTGKPVDIIDVNPWLMVSNSTKADLN